jgi:porin
MHAIRCCSWLAAVCATSLAPTPVAANAAPAATFRPSLTVTGELWQNVRGGASRGGWWNTLVELGAELDLATPGGPAGSSVTAQAHWVENRDTHHCFAETTGAANPASGLMAGAQVRLYNFHYRQKWSDDAVALKLGQLALDDDFMGSDYASLFVNSAFGAMPSQVGTPPYSERRNATAFPVYAVAAPGVHLAARASDSFSWQAGIYHGEPGPDDRRNHGFDWLGHSVSGEVFIFEAAWNFPLGQQPSRLCLGGVQHTGRFTDFEKPNSTGGYSATRGLHSFHVTHDFVLSAQADRKPRVAGFWRAGVAPQHDRSLVATYADAGLNWFAPLPGRPDDIAGVALSHTRFGHAFRAAAGTAASETTVELTYRARITAHFTAQADAQFVFSPACGSAGGEHRTALVLGLRTTLAF